MTSDALIDEYMEGLTVLIEEKITAFAIVMVDDEGNSFNCACGFGKNPLIYALDQLKKDIMIAREVTLQ